MALKATCREVRRLIQSMPKGDCEESLSQVAAHLSECEECRRLFANFQRIEQGLEARKLQLESIASRVEISRSRIWTEIAKIPHARRAWFLRPAWAGAVAFLLLLAGAATLLLNERGIRSPGDPGARTTPRVMTEAAPSATLEQLAQVLRRHEAPSSGLPYALDAFEHEPFYPGIQQYLEPEDTLTTLAQTTVNMTRRNET